MLYGIYSGRDNEATKTVFKGKRIPDRNCFPISGLGALAQVLTENDVVHVVNVNRFMSVAQIFSFAHLCHERGVILHFLDQPYLDISTSKKWKPSIVRLLQKMVENENCAKAYMRQCFRMSDVQWGYVDSCLEGMNLASLAAVFSSDGVMGRGR